MNKEQVIEVLKTIPDPELQLDVWTLGLIYDIGVDAGKVAITMTFTSPLCPYGPLLVESIRSKLLDKGVGEVTVEVTFEPPWKPSEELREMLGV